MKLKTNLQPQVSAKQRQKTLMIYAATGIAVSVIIGIALFFSLNLGRTEDALAASYSTSQSGNWSDASTWNLGNVPGNWANNTATINHNITGTKVSGSPDMSIIGFPGIYLTSGNTFTSTRNLTLSFVNEFISNGSDITINGDLTLSNSTIMTINSGNLFIDGNLTVSNSASLIFNSPGTITVTGNLITSGGAGKEININNGSLNIDGDISLASGSTLNVEDGASLTATNLTTGNNGDAIINVNGNATITNSVDLGGVIDIGETGTMTVGNDFTMRNSGTTQTNVDGLLQVADDINIINRDMTGNGFLDWGGDLNLIGGGSIKGEDIRANIPGPVLDMSTMSATVLPVELLSFDAKKVDNQVVLTWQTASEKNNDYFTIERSINGIDYTSIAEVTGLGTTNEVSSYGYIDHQPLNGLLYYRLKQTDFDGTTETFRPVSVEMEVESSNSITIFPNPILGSQITVKMDKAEEGTIEIFNQNGTKVFSGQLSGFSQENKIKLSSNIKAGVYIANIKTNNNQETVKLLKK